MVSCRTNSTACKPSFPPPRPQGRWPVWLGSTASCVISEYNVGGHAGYLAMGHLPRPNRAINPFLTPQQRLPASGRYPWSERLSQTRRPVCSLLVTPWPPKYRADGSESSRSEQATNKEGLCPADLHEHSQPLHGSCES